MANKITSVLLLSLTIGHDVNGQSTGNGDHQSYERPKIIVFDLDETLWPFLQAEMKLPFRKFPNGSVVDDQGVQLKPYPEVDRVLAEVYSSGIPMAVASITDSSKGANSLIELFGWKKYFAYIELLSGTKLQHFERIKNDSAVDYHEMIFFDNDQENIYEISKIGVTCILVDAQVGMTIELLKYGMDKFEEAPGHSSGKIPVLEAKVVMSNLISFLGILRFHLQNH